MSNWQQEQYSNVPVAEFAQKLNLNSDGNGTYDPRSSYGNQTWQQQQQSNEGWGDNRNGDQSRSQRGGGFGGGGGFGRKQEGGGRGGFGGGGGGGGGGEEETVTIEVSSRNVGRIIGKKRFFFTFSFTLHL